MLWSLWSRNRAGEPQGVYSHQTALSLHELLITLFLFITAPVSASLIAQAARHLRDRDPDD